MPSLLELKPLFHVSLMSNRAPLDTNSYLLDDNRYIPLFTLQACVTSNREKKAEKNIIEHILRARCDSPVTVEMVVNIVLFSRAIRL